MEPVNEDARKSPNTPAARPRRRQRDTSQAFLTALSTAMPRTWVAHTVLAANALLFVAMIATGVPSLDPSSDTMLEWGAGYGPLTVGGQWWRLLTLAFLHFGAVHLALNLWCLYAVGPLLERLLGHTGFATIYVCSALGGSLASLAWHPDVVSAGASGAVFGCYGAMLATATLLGRKLPRDLFESLRGSVIVFLIYNVAFGLRSPTIDHAAHIGGFVVGLLGTRLVFRSVADGACSPMVRADARFAAAGLVILVASAVGVFLHAGKHETVRLHGLWQKLSAAEANQQWDEAVRLTERMLELDPTSSVLHCHRSFYLGNGGRFGDGLAAASRAIELDGYSVWSHVNRAWCLGALGRPAEGAEAASRAVHLDPKLPQARYQLVDCLTNLGRDADALTHTEALLKLDGENARAHRVHSWTLFQLGRHRDSATAIERALAIEPKDEWSLAHRDTLRSHLK